VCCPFDRSFGLALAMAWTGMVIAGLNGHAAEPFDGTLRILTYNIHHGEGTDGRVELERLAQVMTAARPDIVMLQEVDRLTMRTGHVDQTAELSRLTGLHGRFCKQIDYEGGEYGQAILSRFPVSDPVVHWLPGNPERERRIAAEIVISVAARELRVVTTHLHHNQADTRREQALKLNELFQASPIPTILAGDLNANPDSPPLAILAEQWLVASSDPPQATYPAPEPKKVLDYVLARPRERFEVVSLEVLPEAVASDHRPVLAVLRWID
jgi:endonuclease/exonuclease/phosphatase family metal-dependent hydrolase